MKKILLLIISLLLFINVNAAENKLNLIYQEDKVAYESNMPNNVFINHTSMLPGDNFSDEVTISNTTNKDLKLFFKVKTIEQSVKADKLLDNIIMKVYLDNNIVYNGKAKGLDYNNNGVNLQNVIELVTLKPNDKTKLRVDTTLSSNYSENNADLSIMDFVFIVEYDDKSEEIVPVPITGKNVVPYWVVSIVICLIGIVLVIISLKRKKEDNNKMEG